MGFKISSGSPTILDCQNKPLTTLLNAYLDFKKNDSVRPFDDQSWWSGKYIFIDPEKVVIYRPHFEICFAGPVQNYILITLLIRLRWHKCT